MSFDAVVAEHVPMLMRMAKRYCRNPDEAQDLVQDTVEYILRRRLDSKAPNHIRARLLTVLKHRFYDYCRRVKPVPTDEGELAQLPVADSEEERPWDKITVPRLLAAIEMLPEKHQKVYRLYAFEKLKLREISQLLGMPIGTVGTYLMRARESLKEILASELQ